MDNFDKEISEITDSILKLSETIGRHSTPISRNKPEVKSEKDRKDSGISSGVQTEISDTSRTVLLPEQKTKTVQFTSDSYRLTDKGINAATLPLDMSQADATQNAIPVTPINKKDSVPKTSDKTDQTIEPIHKISDKSDQAVGHYSHGNSKDIVKFKPATYDGTGSWLDYKSHFEMVSAVNNWNEQQKGLYLAVSLRGQAQAILGDLPTDKKSEFKILVNALEERFAPPSQTELYRAQFRERRQKSTETLPELGQAIRRLANLAYPTAPRDVCETLAKEQFIDGLFDTDMRLRIKQARPKTLNEAVKLAVELEAFNRAEKQNNLNRGHLRFTGMSESVG